MRLVLGLYFWRESPGSANFNLEAVISLITIETPYLIHGVTYQHTCRSTHLNSNFKQSSFVNTTLYVQYLQF